MRIVLFASGDFAFNLYWQSAMVFLLFYYTDAIHLPIEIAALTYMCASIWDGIVNLWAGILLDRRPQRSGYRRYLVIGALPLGLTFILAYLPPPFDGTAAAVFVFSAHVVFRSAYAMVNVPYLAMSARISEESGDRRLMAGLRMLFATAAFMTVTLGTSSIGGWITGERSALMYLASAAAFAAVSSIVLLIVGCGVREIEIAPNTSPVQVRTSLASLFRNRAFLTLNGAMMMMIIAVTVVGKSVLYFFKYKLGDIEAGEQALAAMAVTGALAIPLWILVSRLLGSRTSWLVAVIIAVPLLGWFGIADISSADTMWWFLVSMQVTFTGFNIMFWSMLPNTIEYGERMTGVRVEGIVFGAAALLQRVALGGATATLGISLWATGYVANVGQSTTTLNAMQWTMSLVPLVSLLISGFLILLNPLAKHAHAKIVAELHQGRSLATNVTTPT